MPSIVRDLFLSKKFVVALLTVVAMFAAYKGWNVDPMTILPFLAPPLAYIGAQGWADSGKEKARIDAAAGIQVQTMQMQRAAQAARDDQKSSATNNLIEISKEPTQ